MEMGSKSFDNYGKIAGKSNSYLEIAGRLNSQARAEKGIILDVLQKLDLKAQDSLLEIGCGAGNLLIPLSFLANKVTGNDHASCLDRLKGRCAGQENIRLLPGDFLDVQFEDAFNKILCYSVLHYLKDQAEVFRFIDKSLQLLVGGGRALFGDVPNQAAKTRFVNSRCGQTFVKEWQALIRRENAQPACELEPDNELVAFDDNFILDILNRYRKAGYHSYVLSQPSELPFGHTREDILIIKPD